MLHRIRRSLVSGLRRATADAGYDRDVDASDVEVEDVDDDEKGEFSSPISFSIAAAADRNPVSVAAAIADVHRSNGLPEGIDTVSVENGHINYHTDPAVVARRTLSEVADAGSAYGRRERANPETIVADVSSPNIAKPLHVGHLRNTILSDAVMNILEARGHDVTRDNHLGDWGVQFGNLMYEYLEHGDETAFEQDPIGHLLDLYQQFERRDSKLEELGTNETFTDRFKAAIEREREHHAESGKEWFSRLEREDDRAVDLWQQFREASIERFEETYADLDVEFDVWIGESFYALEGWTDVVVETALEEGVAMRGEGESVFVPIYPEDLTDVEDPDLASVDTSLDRAREALEGDDEEAADVDRFYIVKSDGSTLYGTRDLATIEYRIQEFDADQSVYVVAREQNRYFQQLFAAARKLGYDDLTLEHIDYGMISLPEGSMSTRKGQVITAREVLDRARQRAHEIVREKGRGVEDELDEVAETVALATVKYEMVSSQRGKDVTFDVDEAVSFEGDTGPYVQYAATRGYGILEEADEIPDVADLDPSAFNETDYELVYELGRYPLVLERCERRYDAAPLAHYLLELAHRFNSFYHENPVLDAESATEERLVLTEAATQVFENGLDLLGIETLERM